MPANNIFVVANIILDCAKEDIEKADEVRMVLRDIWDIRQAKLRRSVDGFIQGSFLHSKLNFLQLIELNAVRPLLPHAFDQINRFVPVNCASVDSITEILLLLSGSTWPQPRLGESHNSLTAPTEAS